MTSYSAPRGTQDFYSSQASLFHHLESTARSLFQSACFEEIKTPCFESTDLFLRGIGTDSDIVSKEMYTFTDKGNRSLTLRPEGTACVIRSVLEHHLLRENPIQKLFYVGPFFRYERPQAGRFRQFHQIGAEALGSDSIYSDLEIIELAYRFFTDLGLNHLTVELNTIGDTDSKQKLSDHIQATMKPVSATLCSSCQTRLNSNPLRLLDCKNKTCQHLLSKLGSLDHCLNDDSRHRFDAVLSGLKVLGIPYAVQPRLVRGLDYYNDTVFEITCSDLGSQNAVCGGGRYDTLIETMGGNPTPAVGFAVGIERLMMVLDQANHHLAPLGSKVMIAPLDIKYHEHCFLLQTQLRQVGICADMGLHYQQLKHHLKYANKMAAQLLIICGEAEINNGSYLVKDLAERSQESVLKNEIINYVQKKL